MNIMVHPVAAPDAATINRQAIDESLSAIAAVNSDTAKAAVAAARAELDSISAAQSEGRARLEELNAALRQQPADASETVASALLAGTRPADSVSSRKVLADEAEALRGGLAVLARKQAAAARAVDQAKANARRPYSVEAVKLIEAIGDTAREHMQALAACYAAIKAIHRATGASKAIPLSNALEDMLKRAQMSDADLMPYGESVLDVPADAQEALAALAALGEPFDFVAPDSVRKP